MAKTKNPPKETHQGEYSLFCNYLNKYRKAVFNSIPLFYLDDSPEDIESWGSKKYFASVLADIERQEETSEGLSEEIKRIERVETAFLRLYGGGLIRSLKPCSGGPIGPAEEGEMLVGEPQDKLDAIARKYTIPPFRYSLPSRHDLKNITVYRRLSERHKTLMEVAMWVLERNLEKSLSVTDTQNQFLEMANDQEREYLKKYGDRIRGQEGEVEKGDTNTVSRFKLVLRTSENKVYWEGKEQEGLSPKPYQLLYVLALTPGELIPYGRMKWLISADTENLPKALSKHISSIKARIPALKNIIHNTEDLGYELRLKKEDVLVQGEIAEVGTLLQLD